MLKLFNEERTVFSTNGAATTGLPHAQAKMQHLNARTETIKLSEENRGKSSWLWIWQGILRYDTKRMSNQIKNR